MISTVAVLRQIRKMCHEADSCTTCKLDPVFCNCSPEQWTNEQIEDLEDIIDDYEEEENVD